MHCDKRFTISSWIELCGDVGVEIPKADRKVE